MFSTFFDVEAMKSLPIASDEFKEFGGKTCMVEPNLGCLTPNFLRIYLSYYLQLFIIIKIHSLWDINPKQIEFSLFT